MDVKILVAGFGNILMKDDGMGVYLCRYLKKKKIEGVEIQEFGVEDWRLSCVAFDFKHIVIVDAVDIGYMPGKCAVWEDVDFTDLCGFSLHHGYFISEMQFIRALKKLSEKIFFFGIQPEKIEWGIGLTERLNARFYSIAERLKIFIESLAKGEIYALH